MSNKSMTAAVNAQRASINQERIKKLGLVHMPIRSGQKLSGNRATKARRINGFLAMKTVKPMLSEAARKAIAGLI